MKKEYLVKAYKKNIGWALFALLGVIVCVFCFVDGNPAGGIVGLCIGIPSLVLYIVLTKKAIKEKEIEEKADEIILNMIIKSCLTNVETQENIDSNTSDLPEETQE